MPSVVVAVVIVMMIVTVMAVAVIVAAAWSRLRGRTIRIVPVFVRFLVRLVADDVADTSGDTSANRRAFAAVPGLVADDRSKNRAATGPERRPSLRVTASGQKRGRSQQDPHQGQATNS